MAITDPGYRYWEQCNVQCSTARQSNANMLAYVDILSQPLTPLAHQDLDHCHPWLLEGQKKETLTINGGTGLCPKLLHIFGQITHLCVMLGKDPESTMLRHGGDGIERVIMGICQSSDLSSGFTSAKPLLDTCVLNEIGQVETEAEVTNLTAEAWRQAALIYLRCRFFRYVTKAICAK
jgi:Fungal specific transcription factor domain